LAAGLRLVPLGEPRPASRNQRGPTSKGREGREREGKGREVKGRRGQGKGREGKGKGGERGKRRDVAPLMLSPGSASVLPG